MKKLTTTLFATALSLMIFAGEGDKNFKIDQSTSSVEWIGKKVTGSHEGTINISGGEIIISEDKIIGGTINIEMSSIKVTDLEDEGMNKKLRGHLMSDDFFGVKNYPTASLKILTVNHKSKNQHTIIGEITIKGKTEKIEIPATILMEEGKVVAIGEAIIDRTKFDIKYGSGQFFEDLGDRMIYDDFTVKFKVGAKL